MKSLVAIVALAFALAACEETPMGPVSTSGPPPPPYAYGPSSAVVFRARDFEWSTVPGPAAIAGALTYRDGPLRYSCEGQDVVLTPETAWTRRRMTILYGSAYSAVVPVGLVRSRIPSAPSGDYVRFVRKVTCDEANHFAFAGLPNGSWFVITLAKPVGSRGETMAVMRRVETRGGHRFVTLN